MQENVESGRGENVLGFLLSPCNQDENHFSWILAWLLSSDVEFRAAFLSSILDIEAVRVSSFVVHYQHFSTLSRPDIACWIRTPDAMVLVFIETKVQSEPDWGQLANHQKGLESETAFWSGEKPARGVLILLAPEGALQSSVPDYVRSVSWETIHRLLVREEVRGHLIAGQFAEVLEGRHMADFGGFDTDSWARYVENAKLIESVEAECSSFVDSVKRLVQRCFLGAKKPWDRFDSTFHDRGKSFEFYICPSSIEGTESHWVMVKIMPTEGAVELSAGTEGTDNSRQLLKFVGSRFESLKTDGWQLWYATGNTDDFVDIGSWKRLSEMRASAVSLVKLHHLASEKKPLSEPTFVKAAFEELTSAAQFLLDLLGSESAVAVASL